MFGERGISGGYMVELAVVAADITERPCDLLLLKHANGFYGVDEIVSELLGFTAEVPEGQATFLPGRNVEARRVVYIGVGPSVDFAIPKSERLGVRHWSLLLGIRGIRGLSAHPFTAPAMVWTSERRFFHSWEGSWMQLNAAHTLTTWSALKSLS